MLTRPVRSTPNVGAHGDGPGEARGARRAHSAAAEAGIETKRGPSIRPSRCASAGSNVLTLYEPRYAPPFSETLVASTTGLYVYAWWYVKPGHVRRRRVGDRDTRCRGPARARPGFGDHHASTGGPMMLTVLVISRKPLPYGCTSVLLTAARQHGLRRVDVGRPSRFRRGTATHSAP